MRYSKQDCSCYGWETINLFKIHLQEFCIILVSVSGEPCDQPDPLTKASNCWVSIVTKPPGWKSKIFALLPMRLISHLQMVSQVCLHRILLVIVIEIDKGRCCLHPVLFLFSRKKKTKTEVVLTQFCLFLLLRLRSPLPVLPPSPGSEVILKVEMMTIHSSPYQINMVLIV